MQGSNGSNQLCHEVRTFSPEFCLNLLYSSPQDLELSMEGNEVSTEKSFGKSIWVWFSNSSLTTYVCHKNEINTGKRLNDYHINYAQKYSNTDSELRDYR